MMLLPLEAALGPSLLMALFGLLGRLPLGPLALTGLFLVKGRSRTLSPAWPGGAKGRRPVFKVLVTPLVPSEPKVLLRTLLLKGLLPARSFVSITMAFAP